MVKKNQALSHSQASAPGLVWPDIGPKAVKITDKDYVQVYGMWRGKVWDGASSAKEAVFKFVQSENLQRLNVKRELKNLDASSASEPLNYIAGFKVAHGRPAASFPVPLDGFHYEKSSVDLSLQEPELASFLQTSRNHSRTSSYGVATSPSRQGHLPDNHLPEISVAFREEESSPGRRGRGRRGWAARERGARSVDATHKSHLHQPFDFSNQERLWKAPEYRNSLPRVYSYLDSFREHRDRFDALSVRELLNSTR